ncbi:hypothetical protein J1605_000665 [Eschrichtius robustus]|uniref:non-specific serine/threonine protein kinase n=1 Tax=Eschrichtius robustus TaxID=9764 RepID=A0AB34GNQ0_ESCRO|nr:hypothetical protein J1605_000665 [Eschrichtius robustus]
MTLDAEWWAGAEPQCPPWGLGYPNLGTELRSLGGGLVPGVTRRQGHLPPQLRVVTRAYCGQCSERIWGLARQGYRCINCKLLVHKRCHVLVPLTCNRHMDSVMPSQEPAVDDKSDNVDLPSEETDGIAYISSTRKHDNIEDEPEDLKPVIDGMDGIKISQGLGLQDFDLLRVIGRGSYAKVLLVRLKKNDQVYAMKVVKKELVHDDEDIDWVQTEKHVFEQASSNPFLVGLHSCFQTTSRRNLVSEPPRTQEPAAALPHVGRLSAPRPLLLVSEERGHQDPRGGPEPGTGSLGGQGGGGDVAGTGVRATSTLPVGSSPRRRPEGLPWCQEPAQPLQRHQTQRTPAPLRSCARGPPPAKIW